MVLKSADFTTDLKKYVIWANVYGWEQISKIKISGSVSPKTPSFVQFLFFIQALLGQFYWSGCSRYLDSFLWATNRALISNKLGSLVALKHLKHSEFWPLWLSFRSHIFHWSKKKSSLEIEPTPSLCNCIGIGKFNKKYYNNLP